jgi:hypothetical protein
MAMKLVIQMLESGIYVEAWLNKCYITFLLWITRQTPNLNVLSLCQCARTFYIVDARRMCAMLSGH